MLLAEQHDLIATLPSRAAWLQKDNPNLIVKVPPFEIPPFELKMAWSPLLQHNSDHQWLRRLIIEVAEEVDRSEEHTSELQSRPHLVCRLLLEKKKKEKKHK